MKKAIISGITGQDGSYLAELLLDKGYEVHGLIRRASGSNTERLNDILSDAVFKNRLFLHYSDLTDGLNLYRIISNIQPDEIYNLAAMSNVGVSFGLPEYVANVDGLGVTRLLEIVRCACPEARLYQASTSELFGKVQEVPQKESTPFYPRSPYAVAKLYAYWAVVNYREAYNLFACNGILFNHESPRRGEDFVTRKITLGVARIFHGVADKLILGNLDAKRDWGYAKDYVEAMWLMLQQNVPEDFVIATGVTTTVRKFVEIAFSKIGITLFWEGVGSDEKGIDAKTGRVLVSVSPVNFRPSEVDLLIGDSTKAQEKLNWRPKTDLNELISIMLESDLELVGSAIKNIGSLI